MGGATRRRFLVVVVLTCTATFGCGAPISITSDPKTTSSTTTSTTTTTTTVAPTVPAPPPPAPDPSVRTVTGFAGFTSPTGNIGCYIDVDGARCDISERDWEPPPQPPDCDLDYGQGIWIGAQGPAEFVCAGDTALSSGDPALPYGHAIEAGEIRCVSEESGMTCTAAGTGHGFQLSRASYRIF